MASRRKEKLKPLKEEMDVSDEDSDGSDGFDPDEMEVPGGGKNIDQIMDHRQGEPSSAFVKTESADDAELFGPGSNLKPDLTKPDDGDMHVPEGGLRNEILNPDMSDFLNQSWPDRYQNFVTNRQSNTGATNNSMPRTNVLPESLNPFQTAASNFLSSFGGNPFASLFSGIGNAPSSFSDVGPQQPSNNNVNTNLGQYSSHMFSNSAMLNKPALDFNRLLGSPAIENLYKAILGDLPVTYPQDNLQNQAYPPGRAPVLGPRLPTTSRRTNFSVTQLWQNANVKMNQFVQPGAVDPAAEQDDDQEEEDMAVAETYADYKPAKLHIGKRHPDPVIETASMASVLPPDVTMDLNLPDKIIKTGRLSALQLEAVTYACQQHEFDLRSGVRSGYLIGDGAGVGKGRTIAGIIYENWLHERRKALWISVSADLKYDSERDLTDIGATMIKVQPLNKLKYGKIQGFDNGVIFSTYSALIGESSQGGKFNTRLKQIVDWCGKNFNGVIVFDECHRAKNLCPTGSSKPTKTGKTVHELQELLPRARVVYASATGASEPRNMAYMTRLGIWGEGTPFPDFQAFISSVEKRGVGAMEIVAMDMKLRGAYIARQLSFQGVTFTIEEVPLSAESIKVYDEAVALWVEAMQKFIEGIELMMLDSRKRKAIWAQFWASHQRFFKYLCIAAKVKKAVQIARDAVKDGKCVVIGLQSTGEARTLDQLERDEGELTDFVSTAKGVLQTLVEKHFPGKTAVPSNGRKASDSGMNGNGKGSSLFQRFLKEMEAEDAAEAENGGASSSAGKKRKPVRRAARKAVKRVKWTDSDDSNAASDKDSDFDAATTESSRQSTSEYESEESIASSNESEAEEDIDLEVTNKRGPKPKKGMTGRPQKAPDPNAPKPSKEAKEIVSSMKTKLLEQVVKLGETLPPNTLDQLIDELGGPTEVAEMTGRKGRVIQDDQGNVSYEARSEAEINLECINLAEKERFMNGEKFIAIISEAASSGISLQSDKRVANQRRRVHITLELPWSADRAIQQFGRTHRSNQMNAPEYVFLISDLAGEHRFASIVAKRLESLGALTHGDRRATESRDLSRFHIDNKYGRMALESVMRGTLKMIPPLIPPPADYDGDFFADMAGALVGVGLIVNSEDARGVPDLDKDYNNMSKFLNRILGMPVKLQNFLFKYFTDTLSFVIKQAKKTGRFDVGIVDLSDNGSNEIVRGKKSTYQRQHATGIGTIELHELQVERGMSWEQAIEKHEQLFDDSSEGFYLAKQVRNNKRTAILAVSESSSAEASKDKTSTYSVYRPNTGLQVKREVLRDLKDKFEKVTAEKAKPYWEDQFRASKTICTHAYWSGNCKNFAATNHCDIGLRLRTYHVLSGSVLLVWGIIEGVFQMYSHGHHTPKMQVVRVRFGEDDRIVGVLIPNYCANELGRRLAEGAVSSSVSQIVPKAHVVDDAADDEGGVADDNNSDFEEV